MPDSVHLPVMLQTRITPMSPPAWAKRLHAARTMSGMTQAALARLVGISQSRYANYEAGTREPDYSTLVAICRALNVTSDFILMGPPGAKQTKSHD